MFWPAFLVWNFREVLVRRTPKAEGQLSGNVCFERSIIYIYKYNIHNSKNNSNNNTNSNNNHNNNDKYQ